MLDYAYGYDEIVAKFVAELIPAVRPRLRSTSRRWACVEGNMLIAGLIYHNSILRRGRSRSRRGVARPELADARDDQEDVPVSVSSAAAARW